MSNETTTKERTEVRHLNIEDDFPLDTSWVIALLNDAENAENRQDDLAEQVTLYEAALCNIERVADASRALVIKHIARAALTQHGVAEAG